MCDDGPGSSSPELDLWHRALAAQVDGDHVLAEDLFGKLADCLPGDAEARFQQAIEAGWSAPRGQNRFDEVLVGVACAIERASGGERHELRRRAGRALTVLGEVRFALSQDDLLNVNHAGQPAPRGTSGAARRADAGTREGRSPDCGWKGMALNEAIVHHLVLAGAILRLLDAALELDPRGAYASEAIVGICDDVLTRVSGPRGLRIAGLGFLGNGEPIEGLAFGRARERAVRHLAALAREPKREDAPSDRRTISSSDRPTIPS